MMKTCTSFLLFFGLGTLNLAKRNLTKEIKTKEVKFKGIVHKKLLLSVAAIANVKTQVDTLYLLYTLYPMVRLLEPDTSSIPGI